MNTKKRNACGKNPATAGARPEKLPFGACGKAEGKKTASRPKNFRYVVTAVDTSDSADGKARVLKVCKTRKAAENFVESDIADYAAAAEGVDLVVERRRMSAHAKDHSYGCEWNVERVDMK